MQKELAEGVSKKFTAKKQLKSTARPQTTILKNSKLIDDYDFTKNYILNAVTYKKKSLNVVKYELKIKGISNFIIKRHWLYYRFVAIILKTRCCI